MVCVRVGICVGLDSVLRLREKFIVKVCVRTRAILKLRVGLTLGRIGLSLGIGFKSWMW